MLYDITALIAAMVAHELGHYIHYYILGFKPKLKWIGIGPCVEAEEKNIAVRYVLLNMLTAITSGLVVLSFFQVSDLIFFAYFVGCFMDINNMQMILIFIWRKTMTLDTNINDIKLTVCGKPMD